MLQCAWERSYLFKILISIVLEIHPEKGLLDHMVHWWFSNIFIPHKLVFYCKEELCLCPICVLVYLFTLLWPHRFICHLYFYFSAEILYICLFITAIILKSSKTFVIPALNSLFIKSKFSIIMGSISIDHFFLSNICQISLFYWHVQFILLVCWNCRWSIIANLGYIIFLKSMLYFFLAVKFLSDPFVPIKLILFVRVDVLKFST